MARSTTTAAADILESQIVELKLVEPKLHINVPSEPPASAEREAQSSHEPATLNDWPPSDMKPTRERLEEWLRLFLALERWEQVDECERLLFQKIEDREELHDMVMRSGDRWWRTAGDLMRARNRYREAVQIDRMSERAHTRLRAVAHELGRRRVQPFRPAGPT